MFSIMGHFLKYSPGACPILQRLEAKTKRTEEEYGDISILFLVIENVLIY